ncbi:hypothetical protein MTO96_006170 [Rhipicephalus appendiculatus]
MNTLDKPSVAMTISGRSSTELPARQGATYVAAEERANRRPLSRPPPHKAQKVGTSRFGRRHRKRQIHWKTRGDQKPSIPCIRAGTPSPDPSRTACSPSIRGEEIIHARHSFHGQQPEEPRSQPTSFCFLSTEGRGSGALELPPAQLARSSQIGARGKGGRRGAGLQNLQDGSDALAAPPAKKQTPRKASGGMQVTPRGRAASSATAAVLAFRGTERCCRKKPLGGPPVAGPRRLPKMALLSPPGGS